MVAPVEAKKGSNKRKTVEEETLPPLSAFPQEVGLEMGSEDEGEEPDDCEGGASAEDEPMLHRTLSGTSRRSGRRKGV